MSLRLKRGPRPLAVDIEIAPFIDIVFQQLIFFMLTSAFVFQPGVKIHLPKTVTADVVHRETQVITVTKNDSLYLGNRILTLAELRLHLGRARGSRQPILIRADRGSSLGRVVEIWDLCRALGLSQVNIATGQSNEGAPHDDH